MKPESCPKCGATPFDQFLPHFVTRWPWKFLFFGPRPEYAVICRGCKEIVGHEWEDEAVRALHDEFMRHVGMTKEAGE